MLIKEKIEANADLDFQKEDTDSEGSRHTRTTNSADTQGGRKSIYRR